MRPRRVSKAIQVGDVTVGGNAPITVQSMTKTDTRTWRLRYGRLRSWRRLGVKSYDLPFPIWRQLWPCER